MSASILTAAGELLAIGLPADLVPVLLPGRVRAAHEPHLAAVEQGEELPDLERLAQLVVADGLDPEEAEHLLLGDIDTAIFEAEHRLAHPDPDDDRRVLERQLARLRTVRDTRRQAWWEAERAADFVLDAVSTYTAAAPAEQLQRPTGTIEEAAATIEAQIDA